MQCHEFEHLLNAILDQRQSPPADPLLTAHAARCYSCQQLLVGQQALFFGLAKLAVPSQGREFSRRVVATATITPHRHVQLATRRAWFAVAAAASAAAAMLLAISLAWQARHRLPVLVDNQSLTMPSTMAAKSAGSNASRLAILQSGRAPRRIAVSGQPTFTGGNLLLEAPRLSAHYRHYCGAMDELAIALPGAVERLEEMEQMAPGIRPLRVSLTIVWDALCRTLPGARSNASPPPPTRSGLLWMDAIRLA
jgi:hypothetical protein